MAQCKARARSGAQCRKLALRGKEVCRLHGGKSPSGLASPSFKHGRRSRYMSVLTPEMAKRFKSAAADPDQLSLAAEIMLLDARVAALLDQIKQHQDADWKAAQESFEAFARSQAERDATRAVAALHELGGLLRRGAKHEKLWEQVGNLAWTKRPKLVKSETERQLLLKQLVERELVVNLLSALTESVKRNVSDRTALQKISDDFLRLAGSVLAGCGMKDEGEDDGVQELTNEREH